MSLRAFKLLAEPYGHVVYVLEADAAQGVKWFKRRAHCDADLTDCEGMTVMPDGADVYVWVEAPAHIRIVVHELTHATLAILAGAGVPVTHANEEAIAYLLASLTEKCIAKLTAQRERIKMAQLVQEGKVNGKHESKNGDEGGHSPMGHARGVQGEQQETTQTSG